ncbi:MAG: TonB family protein [Proteobacteria bacterium]|nr:TonB family protein [Pseudomonadota bacterium]
MTEPPPFGPTVGAQLLTRAIPPYPMLDVRLGHEGIVTLKLSINTSGAVTDAVVTRSSGFDTLDAAAVAWVKAKWRYKPAQQNGQAVPSTSPAAVKFELKGR